MSITQREKLILFLFWLSIAYAAQWLNGIIFILSDSYIIEHLFGNHARPFITLFFSAIIYFLSYDSITFKDIPKLVSFKLMIVALIFMVIEIIHFPGDYSFFKQFKYLFYSKVISSLWTCVIIIFIIEIFIKKFNKLYFILHLIYIISFKAIVYMFIAVLLLEEIIPLFINNLIFNATQAYESLAIIFIILFSYISMSNDWKKYVFIYVNALPIFFFEVRGASLTLILVSIFFLIETSYRKLILKRKMLLFALLPLMLLSFLTLKGFAPLGITTFNRIIKKEFSVKKQKKEQIQTRKLLINMINFFRKSSEDYDIDMDDVLEMNERTLSAFSRMGTIILGFTAFDHHPIFGIGSHNAYALKVSGYGIHSLIPLILASYGMIGFLPLAFFCVFVISKYVKETGDFLGMLLISTFIILLMTFINSFSWIYSFAVMFFYYAKSDDRLRCPISKYLPHFIPLKIN